MRELEFDSEVADRWTIANSVLTLIFAPILLIFPILAPWFMHRNFEQLTDENLQTRYGVIYEGYSTSKRSMLLYWFADYVRKNKMQKNEVLISMVRFYLYSLSSSFQTHSGSK